MPFLPSDNPSGDGDVDTREVLSQITKRQDLSHEDAASVMHELMTGAMSATQIGALLTGLHMKGETDAEIAGFAQTMRKLATRIDTKRAPLVDTCGTGGDHAGTFNISTTAAFVVAGAGVAVAKHGNRSATSKCGSADVLETLGVNIEASPEVAGHCIDEVGIGFLFARSCHTAMKHVAPIRQELGHRTVFNILGPLTNPAGADRQVIGVFDVSLLEKLANVLLALGSKHAFVVAGADGLDEFTITDATHVAEVAHGEVRLYDFTPEEAGLERAPNASLAGGDAAENASILKEVLAGATGPRRDIVLLNASAALVAGEMVADIPEGISVARQSIDSGAAKEKLNALVTRSNDS